MPAPLDNSPHRSTRRRWAATTPVVRLLLASAAAVVSGLATAAAAESRPTQRLESPRRAEIALAATAIPDSTLTAPATQRLLGPGTYWGGRYTASTGETVTVYVSAQYPQDSTVAQRWADFLSSLVHGSELSQVTLYLAPDYEVQSLCGRDALACYGAARDLLVVPGDDPSSDLSAEAVATHEYGHHIASHRANPPWAAVDYGTKRWASYEQVCARTRRGELAPGAEQPPAYQRNPGEAFAETYRVLNERKAGLPEPAWDIVDQALYPDDTALARLELDVTTPWQHTTTLTRAGSGTRTYTVATPFDGTIRATTTRARATVTILAPSGTRLARGTNGAAATVCGQRTVKIRVAAGGGFRLTVARP